MSFKAVFLHNFVTQTSIVLNFGGIDSKSITVYLMMDLRTLKDILLKFENLS